MNRVRVSARMLFYMSGSGPWQGETYSGAPDEEAAARSMIAKLKDASAYADKSIRVDLTPAEVEVLADYAESLCISAGDELGDPDNRADWNTGRALYRNLTGRELH